MHPPTAILLALCIVAAPSTAGAHRAGIAPLETGANVAPSPGWYYSAAGRTVGPLDDAAFVDAYVAGHVTDTTPVWVEGMAEWAPLAQAPRFFEIDRWYVRHGTRVEGPMTGAAVRASLAQSRAEGRSVEALEVRLGSSGWMAVTAAAPLQDTTQAPAPLSTKPTGQPAAATPAEPPPARDASSTTVPREVDNGRALVTITPRIGLGFPGAATPTEISRTKLGFGLPVQIDSVFAVTDHLELGSYFHYSIRPITERGTAPTDGLRTHLVSGGAVIKARFPVSARSRMRIGLLVGVNAIWQGFENDTFTGTITGKGLNIGPSLEWSLDIAPHVAFDVQLAAISQVWGRADIGPLGAVVANGSTQDLAFPPLAFLAVGVDFCLGKRL